MEALHPILMRFMGSVLRQSVNQQIFRRPPIAESGSQIDLEPADAADLLNAREVGLSLPQRGGSHVFHGYVAANDEHASNAVVFIDRTVTVGPVNLLQPAVARDRDQLVLVPGGAAATHYLLDLRADDVPDLRPAFPSALTERARMALRSHGLAIGVVIELNEFWTPPDEHRVVGVQQDP